MAATAVGLAVAASSGAVAQDQVQAGVSAAVRGDVQVARLDAVGRQVNGGEAIYLQDAITSGPDSGMQILLLDETVFTIGPESEMTIDEFVYDPATGEGSLAANMTRGVMRFVTGNISDGTPENMTIQLPVGTIGIRGTIGVAAVLTPDQATQQFPDQAPQLGGGPGQPVVFAALAGPGPLTQTNANTGSFNFSSPDGSVDLNRPGGAVLATPGQPPVFFIAPPGAIQNVTRGFRGGGAPDDGDAESQDSGEESGGDDGDQASDSSGDGDSSDSGQSQQSSSSSSSRSGSTSGVSQRSGASNDASFTQVMQTTTVTAETTSTSETATDVSQSSANAVSFSDVIGSTSSTISQSTSFSQNGFSFNYFTEVNVSNRQIQAHFSNVNNGSGMTSGDALAQLSFSNASGTASFSTSNFSRSNGCETHCSDILVSFTDVNTQNISITINNSGGSEVTITGEGINLE